MNVYIITCTKIKPLVPEHKNCVCKYIIYIYDFKKKIMVILVLEAIKIKKKVNVTNEAYVILF